MTTSFKSDMKNKVLSFLESMKNKDVPDKEHLPVYLTSSWLCNSDIYKFYSQSFRPELITELFEGWDGTEDDGDGIWRYINELNQHVTFADWDKFSYSLAGYPRTLDDFINDCQRAGIELEWKEQENGKYY